MTTNLAANLDAAFERRFLYKIKFENPSAQAKTAIWQEKLNWLSCDEAEQLAVAYDFSGGEIDNIVRKVAMEEIISGKKSFACRNRSNVQNGKIEYRKRKKNWICVIAILNINVILSETKNLKIFLRSHYLRVKFCIIKLKWRRGRWKKKFLVMAEFCML